MSSIKNNQHDNRFIFPEKFENLKSVKAEKPGVKKYNNFFGLILKLIGKTFHLEKGSNHQETWMNKKSVIKFINHNRMEFLAVLPNESVLEKPLTKKTSRLVLQRLLTDYLQKGPSKRVDHLLEPHPPQEQQPLSPIQGEPSLLPPTPDPVISIEQPLVKPLMPPVQSHPTPLESDENDPSKTLNAQNPETIDPLLSPPVNPLPVEIDHADTAALPEKKAFIEWDHFYTIQPPQKPSIENIDQPQKAEITLSFENQVRHLFRNFQFEPETPPSKLLEHFALQLNVVQEQNLKQMFLVYMTEHFGIDPDLVKEVIFDEKAELNQLSLTACLELTSILKPITPEKSALIDLEKALKNALKTKHHFSDDQQAPISYSTWTEIPLRELLILSDRQIYHLEPEGDDYQYLFEELVQKGTMKSPIQVPYSEDDKALFLEKCQRLNLNTIPKVAQTAPIEEKNKEPVGLTSYERVERLIKLLCEEEEIHYIPDIIEHYCPLLLEDDTIKCLYIKELDNTFYGLLADKETNDCNLFSNNELKKQNRRQFAIYLWNALVFEEHVPTECPESLRRWAGKFGMRKANNKFIISENPHY